MSKNKNIGSICLGILSSGLSLCYPFIFYFYGTNFPFLGFLAILLFVMVLRSLNSYFNNQQKWSFLEANILIYVAIIGISMITINHWDPQLAPYLYPVVNSLTLGIIFAKSLLYPPSLIERLARLKEPNLDVHGVFYTRKVTCIWALFCFFNAVVSGATALWVLTYPESTLWTLYNGFISYMIIGIIMASEYLIRCHVKSKERFRNKFPFCLENFETGASNFEDRTANLVSLSADRKRKNYAADDSKFDDKTGTYFENVPKRSSQ